MKHTKSRYVDPVTQCLGQSDGSEEAIANWENGVAHRAAIHQCARSCVIRHGGMLVVVAILSSIATWALSQNLLTSIDISQDEDTLQLGMSLFGANSSSWGSAQELNWTFIALPVVMALIAVLLSLVLVLGLMLRWS